MSVLFSELLLLRFNENVVFFFKITQNNVKDFLSKTLDKAYSNQLRCCNLTRRNKKYVTLISTP